MDSGASDTMFVSRDVFTEYKLVTPQKGDLAKAENRSFKIIGEGDVVQCYQVDGKEKHVTYTCALHTPTLNANLVSMSTLDNAGLTTTFANGKGVTRKADGTIVLNLVLKHLVDITSFSLVLLITRHRVDSFT